MANFPVINASSKTEDGVAFRYLSTTQTDRGIQFNVKLPSSKTLQGWHFINFYTGLGDFECGVSACPSKFTGWRIFFRNHLKSGRDPVLQFKDGDTLNLKLYLDDRTGKVCFQVNFKEVDITSIGTNFSNHNEFFPRVVAGAAQGKGEGVKWITEHTTVQMSGIQKKNSSKVWSSLTNGTPEYVNISINGEPKHKAAKVAGNHYKVSLVEPLT